MHATTANRTLAKTAGSTPIRHPSEQTGAQRDEMASLEKQYARLSASAAQARGRGEWALAAQVATQLASLAKKLTLPLAR